MSTPMQFGDTVQLTLQAHVALLRIQRPAAKNALDRATYRGLIQACQQVLAWAQAEQVQALVLTGTDNCFTAGNDLHDFIGDIPQLMQGDSLAPGLQFLLALRAVPVPVVAAVEGPAIGIGTTMLLHCDYVVAADNAQLRMPFTSLGVCPEGGASELLPHFVGHRQAQAWLLSGESISAQQALQHGLVTAVCPAGQALAMAQQVAQGWAKLPLPSLVATKALLQQGFDAQACFEREQAAFVRCLQSPQTQAVLKAFFQR